MTFFILLIVIMLAVIALAEPLGERIGVVAPVLLLVLSAAVAFLPQVPDVVVDPEIILQLILPPLLFATAMRMPVHDFRRNFSSIFLLAVVLVVLTAVSVGWVIHLLVPAIPLPIAIAVGAVVSPSDAVAVGIVKKAGVNRRIIAILDGEGLINDASALVTLGTALLAARTKVTAGEVLLNFVWAVAGAVIVGFLVGQLAMFMRRHVHHPTSNTVLSLAIPFAAFLPAEVIGASGLVSTVVAGLVVARKAVGVLGPSIRISDAQTWDTLGLVLESLVFVLMGLQMPELIDDARTSGYTFLMSFGVAMACWATVLVVRTAVVMPMMSVMRSNARRTVRRMERLDAMGSRIEEAYGDPRMHGDERYQRRLDSAQQTLDRRYRDARYFAEKSLGFRAGSVIVWAGMRGAITLAAAQTLPHDAEGRGFLVLVAFIVAGMSLIVQGGTLRFLVDAVNPGKDEPSSWEDRKHQREVLSTAAEAVEVPADLERALRAGGLTREKMRTTQVQDLVGALRSPGYFQMDGGADDIDASAIPQQLADYGIARVKAQRDALVAERNAGRIDADDFSHLLRRLDGTQLSIEAQSEAFMRTGFMGGNDPHERDERHEQQL